MEDKYYMFVTKRESQRSAYNVLSFFAILASLLFVYAVICAVIKDRFNGLIIPHAANCVIIFALVFIGIALAYKRCDDFRGVLLFNDYLQIQRHEISSVHPFPVNPKILYTDIVAVEKHAWKPENSEEWNDRQLLIVGGYGLDYVKITDNLDRKYIFCIEKCDEFMEEINKRIQVANNNRDSKTK